MLWFLGKDKGFFLLSIKHGNHLDYSWIAFLRNAESHLFEKPEDGVIFLEDFGSESEQSLSPIAALAGIS